MENGILRMKWIVRLALVSVLIGIVAISQSFRYGLDAHISFKEQERKRVLRR